MGGLCLEFRAVEGLGPAPSSRAVFKLCASCFCSFIVFAFDCVLSVKAT